MEETSQLVYERIYDVAYRDIDGLPRNCAIVLNQFRRTKDLLGRL